MMEPVGLHMFIRKLHVIVTATLWKISKFSPSRYPDENGARYCVSSPDIVHRQRPLGGSLAKRLILLHVSAVIEACGKWPHRVLLEAVESS
jgi:hypothetical protein